jgi:chromosome partitioning protein
LAAAEVELVTKLGRELLLRKKIEAAKHDFDFILLDCPPSLGLLTINALAASSEVMIPMQPHFLALQGVAKLLETVQLVNRRMNPKLKVSGVILTMFDSQTKLTQEVCGELENFIEEAKGKNLPWGNAVIFDSVIRRNIKLAECPSFGQTILQYGSSSNGASDYRSLAMEVMEMTEAAAPAKPQAAKLAVALPKPAPAVKPATPVATTAPINPTKLAAAKTPESVTVGEVAKATPKDEVAA